MANVKHIYSGAGDPYTLMITPVGAMHHYIDTTTGNLWLSTGEAYKEWALIYDYQSSGNLAFYDDTNATDPSVNKPEGPALYWDAAEAKLFIIAGGRTVEIATVPAPS